MQLSRPQKVLGLAALLLTAGCSGGANTMPPLSVPNSSTGAPVAAVAASSIGPTGSKALGKMRRMAAVAGPDGFSAMRVVFNKDTIADEGFVVANFAKQYGISTIFLEVQGADIGLLEAQDPQTVANLNAMFNVATVYIMTGNASWIANPTTVPSDVTNIVRKIAPTYPRFAGILYNIEPATTQTSAYFQLLDTLLAGSQPYTFGTTMIDVNASWRRLPNRTGGSNPSMLQQAESYPAVTGTYLQMLGGSSQSQMTVDANVALHQLLKPYWSGADAMSSRGNSYLGQTASYLTSNLSSVASQTAAINPQLAGVSVDEWDDGYGSLQSILPQPMPAPVAQPKAPLMPPAGQSYLGAYVDPNKTGDGAAAVATFESAIGRRLAYDLHFIGWSAPFVDSDMNDDANKGRAPLLAWQCGDSDARVAAGADDAQIIKSAAQAKAYGHPIFLRFLWEMNLPVLSNRASCWDPSTDLPNQVLSPTHFIAAWRHIHSLFVAGGATNVIWVWNESTGGPNPAEYYPGSDDVDWVGIDAYDRTDAPFSNMISPFLNSTAQYAKPIMISETGASPNYQPTYFPQIVNTLGTSYPLVKAISYFDGSGIDNWTLSSAGVSGFASMGQQAAFSAYPQI